MFRKKGLIKPVEFDWNEFNKDKNWTKHNVENKECEEIFYNKPLKTYPDKKHSLLEKRFVAFGMTNKQRKLTAIFTIRNNKLRIISARNMSRKERNVYEKI